MKKILIVFIVLILVCAVSIAFVAVDNEGNINIGYWVLISCIGGGVAAVGTAIGILYSYRRNTHSVLYPLEKYASMELTDIKDIYLSRHVTRTKISSSKNKI